MKSYRVGTWLTWTSIGATSRTILIVDQHSKFCGTRRVSQDLPVRAGTHSRISCAMNSANGVI